MSFSCASVPASSVHMPSDAICEPSSWTPASQTLPYRCPSLVATAGFPSSCGSACPWRGPRSSVMGNFFAVPHKVQHTRWGIRLLLEDPTAAEPAEADSLRRTARPGCAPW
ncbi:unnamed protein product [Prorocentrum cordatum]|uniref:Uncharacterized protein n=1 Tax=Prorocentrum cordatum TaxID=2364126 RepID=A0ABN9WZG9_9DINO|nr:unnamed protein product [Polarella glacialis]